MIDIGTINGQRTFLHIPERRDAAGPVPTPTLFVGDHSLRLDSDNWPWRDLREALPQPMLHSSIVAWARFVAIAKARGYLRCD